MPILTHTYHGPAWPVRPSEGGAPSIGNAETIGGAFRVLLDKPDEVLLGNGEKPEQFWLVRKPVEEAA